MYPEIDNQHIYNQMLRKSLLFIRIVHRHWIVFFLLVLSILYFLFFNTWCTDPEKRSGKCLKTPALTCVTAQLWFLWCSLKCLQLLHWHHYGGSILYSCPPQSGLGLWISVCSYVSHMGYLRQQRRDFEETSVNDLSFHRDPAFTKLHWLARW